MKYRMIVLVTTGFLCFSCGSEVPEDTDEVTPLTDEFAHLRKKPIKLSIRPPEDKKMVIKLDRRLLHKAAPVIVEQAEPQEEAPEEMPVAVLYAGDVEKPVITFAMSRESPLANGMIATLTSDDGGHARDPKGFPYFSVACVMDENGASYGHANMPNAKTQDAPSTFWFKGPITEEEEVKEFTIDLSVSLTEGRPGDLFGRVFTIALYPADEEGNPLPMNDPPTSKIRIVERGLVLKF